LVYAGKPALIFQYNTRKKPVMEKKGQIRETYGVSWDFLKKPEYTGRGMV
jgi:hypothetical protein